MFRYEIKKVFSKTSSKIAVLLLLVIVGIVCWFATDVYFVNEQGVETHGHAAVRQLREAQKAWAGVLNEEKLRRAIEENARINATPEAQSGVIIENNIAYGWKQGFQEIRNLLNCAYAEGFRSYDYYRADSLHPDQANSFYDNRVGLLKEWLAGEAADQFSEPEKDYLIRQYETLDTPFYYDYMKGWTQLMTYAPTIIMISVLILGFLVAGIFANEFSWKSDAIFFTAAYGRNKAVAAKVKAGFCIVTFLYWITVLLFSGFVLLYLGADGASCPVQADFAGWKVFYHIEVWQEYLLTVVGGYVGSLFIAFLSMLISARTKSEVLAVMTPFVLIFIPSFLGNIDSPAVSRILGLLPDRLLQIATAIKYFELYEFAGKVTGAIPVLFVLYGVLAVALPPVTYQVYRRQQVS